MHENKRQKVSFFNEINELLRFPFWKIRPSTVAEQIRVLKDQFKIEDVVMVGDRGMIKAKGKTALDKEGWHYITAMTDAQIRTLLKKDVLQADLFDSEICEVDYGQKRLILRRNDSTRDREALRRKDKLAALQEKIAARNTFVGQHPRAKAQAGLNLLTRWSKSHKLAAFVTLSLAVVVKTVVAKSLMLKQVFEVNGSVCQMSPG